MICIAGKSILRFNILCEVLRVAADEEIPLAKTAPVVHGGHPTVGGLVFGIRVLVALAFYFQNEGDAGLASLTRKSGS